MYSYSKRFGLAFSLVAALSMAFMAFAVPASARVSAGPHAGKPHAGKTFSPQNCKKRNKASGTIKYSDWQFPDTLNIYQTGELVSQETYAQMILGLYRYDTNARVAPMMLTQVPSIKNGGVTGGGKTIILHLKHGMRWSNDAEITSKDVKFGFQVDSDKLTGPACSGSCDAISRIDTPDKYTAILHLKHIYAPAVPSAFPDVWPAKWAGAWDNDPHAAAQKLGQDASFNFEGPNFPTDGPFQVAEFVNNDRIVLHPMKYFNMMNCGAYVQTMIFAFYSSKASLIAAGAAKQTDVTFDYTPADLPDLKAHSDAYKTLLAPSFLYEHFRFNYDATYNGKPNPVHNTKVRQALALALDKYGLIQSALGMSRKDASSLIGWTPWINTPTLTQAFADKKINGQWDPLQKKYVVPGSGKALADARKLLAQTPFKDGFSLDGITTSGNPTRQAQYAVAQNNWARIGVKFTPAYFPASKYFADWDHGGPLSHGQFQVAMYANEVGPEPDALKYNLQSQYIERERSVHPCAVCGNDGGVKDKLIDKDFDLAAKTFDKATRQKYYSAIQGQLNKNAYWIILYFRPQIYTKNKHVLNMSLNPSSVAEWNSWIWKAGPKY